MKELSAEEKRLEKRVREEMQQKFDSEMRSKSSVMISMVSTPDLVAFRSHVSSKMDEVEARGTVVVQNNVRTVTHTPEDSAMISKLKNRLEVLDAELERRMEII